MELSQELQEIGRVLREEILLRLIPCLFGYSQLYGDECMEQHRAQEHTQNQFNLDYMLLSNL